MYSRNTKGTSRRRTFETTIARSMVVGNAERDYRRDGGGVRGQRAETNGLGFSVRQRSGLRKPRFRSADAVTVDGFVIVSHSECRFAEEKNIRDRVDNSGHPHAGNPLI